MDINYTTSEMGLPGFKGQGQTKVKDKIKTKKRRKGTRRKVSRDAKLPMYFAGFLQDTTNKEELFSLLKEGSHTTHQVNMCTLSVVHM